MPVPSWQIWADTGGTFTDAIGIAPDGAVLRAKVLSSGCLRARVADITPDGQIRLEHAFGDWGRLPDAAKGWRLRLLGRDDACDIEQWGEGGPRLSGALHGLAIGSMVEIVSGEEAPILAARLLTLTPARAALPPIHLRLATTRATNALLTGAAAPTAFVTNRGLGDLLLIGTQQRPDLFALDIHKPAPLHAAVIEVPGRLDANGREIEPLDLDALRRRAADVLAAGVVDAAVCLLHADLNDSHERIAEEVLLEAGFRHVTRSSAVAPFVKIVPRATTALVNASLTSTISSYVQRIRAALAAPGSSLLAMTSAGGLVSAEGFLPKDSLLSGPAAGVIGAAYAAAGAGLRNAVSFDMGGTSTDAARWSAEHGVEYVFQHAVGPVTMLAPAAAVETVAAGGGSICTFRNGALSVGPESAGAHPGPACYGAGGPLTLTDVNLLLGRLCPARFAIPVDVSAAERALSDVAGAARAATGKEWSRERLLEGFLEIAAERMASAVRRTSTRRGHDLRGAALVAFGGAGAQHACAVADRLGLTTVIVPRDAGLLSARGLGAASIERFAERQVLATLDAVSEHLDSWLNELGSEAAADVRTHADESAVMIRRRIASLRFVGQDASIEIDLPRDGRVTTDAIRGLFDASHRATYGFSPGEREVEIVWLRVVAAASAPHAGLDETLCGASEEPSKAAQRACFAGTWHDVPVHSRDAALTTAIDGPAILVEAHSTIVIEPGWRCRANESGDVVLERASAVMTEASTPADTEDPAQIELFTARFEAVAAEMGEMLARTSVSVNVKERLDFSCALLDAQGSLIACAPHVPVHLGSLGVCVRTVVAALPLGPGDSAITNHPAHGGSHLPDLTVITPVHDDRSRLLGYVASRAHHAEIGGRAPGSMPPDATSLGEEGVVLAPFKVVRSGEFRERELADALRSGPYPSRAVADNIADIRAALAANARGAAMLRTLADTHGPDAVGAFMEAIQRRSERLLRECIAATGSFDRTVRDQMDDGSVIQAHVCARGDAISVDFTGSAAVHPGNLNATTAIVSSCLVYVMRLLVGHSVPLNEGLLRPVKLTLPRGMLNPDFVGDAASMPAVVGGNVETSQRIVDVLLRALGLCACSQGTMNNLVFGDETRSYYETICGGAGAGPGFDGASAVHTHMTNTRITDPEVLERRYPVRLERFAVRRGSGGAGQFRGGDGVERVLRFLAPLRVSLLTQRRFFGPPALGDARPGAAGSQTLERATGERLDLPPIAGVDALPGDVLTIRTPGGGGYGVQQRANDKGPGLRQGL